MDSFHTNYKLFRFDKHLKVHKNASFRFLKYVLNSKWESLGEVSLNLATKWHKNLAKVSYYVVLMLFIWWKMNIFIIHTNQNYRFFKILPTLASKIKSNQPVKIYLYSSCHKINTFIKIRNKIQVFGKHLAEKGKKMIWTFRRNLLKQFSANISG